MQYYILRHTKYKIIINSSVFIQKPDFISLPPAHPCPLVNGKDYVEVSFFLSYLIPHLLL